MRKALRVVLLVAAFSLPAAALACGYCVEDKIAAVYDHAAVTRAIEEKHTIVFFAIDGPLKPGDATRGKIQAIARSAQGVDRDSVRVSVDLATLAVAFDPRRANLAAVQGALDRRLAPLGLSLLAIRVMDRPGDLAEMRRAR